MPLFPSYPHCIAIAYPYLTLLLAYTDSDFHPETWNPMWSVSTILTGLVSFMVRPLTPKIVYIRDFYRLTFVIPWLSRLQARTRSEQLLLPTR